MENIKMTPFSMVMVSIFFLMVVITKGIGKME